MRSVILWLVWMLYWIVMATGTPSFFPEWIQAVTWAIGCTGCVLLISWAKHVEVFNTRLTAKDEDIERLEKQLLNQSSPQLHPSLDPVSLVKVSEVHEETPKLFPAEPIDDPPTQDELKTQALKTANKLYGAINNAKQQAGGVEIQIYVLYETQLGDFRNTKEKRIVDSILRYYGEELHDNAVELKTKILVSEGTELLPIDNYTNPQGLRALEAIAEDLKNIASLKPQQSKSH